MLTRATDGANDEGEIYTDGYEYEKPGETIVAANAIERRSKWLLEITLRLSDLKGVCAERGNKHQLLQPGTGLSRLIEEIESVWSPNAEVCLIALDSLGIQLENGDGWA